MSILTALELLPLFGSLVIVFAPKDNSKLIKQIALATSLLVTAAALVMAFQFKKNLSGFQFVEVRPWIPLFNVNYAVGVDGMALLLIVMSTILVPVVFVAGWNESENGRFGVKTFYILMLVLETMMIGVFAATDVILFYVIFEAMLIPVYFLIGGYGRGERAAAAMKFLLYSLFGGLLMLAAVIGLYFQSLVQVQGSFDITKLSQMQIPVGTQNWLFLGFFIAFAIKAPLVPFHTWLPDAAKSATPGTSVLLLGVLDKVAMSRLDKA